VSYDGLQDIGRKTAVVGIGMNVERQLFRLAYELGRIYFHTSGGKGAKKTGCGRMKAEHAARRFAALFLMPEDAVCTTVHQLGIQQDQWTWELLLRIKHRFGVSAESLLYRLGDQVTLLYRCVRVADSVK